MLRRRAHRPARRRRPKPNHSLPCASIRPRPPGRTTNRPNPAATRNHSPPSHRRHLERPSRKAVSRRLRHLHPTADRRVPTLPSTGVIRDTRKAGINQPEVLMFRTRFGKLGLAAMAAVAGVILVVSTAGAHQTHVSGQTSLAPLKGGASSTEQTRAQADPDAAALRAEAQQEAAEAQQDAAEQAAEQAAEAHDEAADQTQTNDDNQGDDNNQAAATETA